MKYSISRRMSVLLLSILMLATLIVPQAFAANEAVIVVDTSAYTTVQPGDELVIPVRLTQNPGIASMAVEMVYNSEIFDPPGGVLKNAYDIAGSVFESDRPMVGNKYTCIPTVSNETGVLFNFKLTVKNDAPNGTFDIVAHLPGDDPDNMVDYDENHIQTTFTNATITIANGRADGNVVVTGNGDSAVNTGYNTVKEALTAIQGSTVDKTGTITMYKDVSEPGPFNLQDGDNIIFDMNGRTLTMDKQEDVISSGDAFLGPDSGAASLVIRSSKGDSGTILCAGSAIKAQSGGAFTAKLESGTLRATTDAVTAFFNSSAPWNFEMTGGCIENEYGYAISGYDKVLLPADKLSQFSGKISGGKIAWKSSGCPLGCDVMTISGGKFKATDGTNPWIIAEFEDGYYLSDTADTEGYYSVLKLENPVASVNGREYYGLKGALNAAGENDTVKIINDFATGEAFEVKKPVTIDMQGHTITQTTVNSSIINVYSNLNLKSTGDKGVIRYAASKDTAEADEGAVSTNLGIWIAETGDATVDNIELRNIRIAFGIYTNAHVTSINNCSIKNVWKGFEVNDGATIDSITNTFVENYQSTVAPDDAYYNTGTALMTLVENGSVTLGEGNQFHSLANHCFYCDKASSVFNINGGSYEGAEAVMLSWSTVNITGGDFYAHNDAYGTIYSVSGTVSGGRYKSDKGWNVWNGHLNGGFTFPTGQTGGVTGPDAEGYYTFTPHYIITSPAPVEGAGTITAPANAAAGDKVEVTVTPAEGKSLVNGSLKYTTISGTVKPITKSADNKYVFTMPAEAVTISGEFGEGYSYALGLEITDTENHVVESIPVGQNVSVAVKVTSSTAYNGYNLVLAYDKDAFEYVTGAMDDKVNAETGKIVIQSENATADAQPVADLVFRAKAAKTDASFGVSGKLTTLADSYGGEGGVDAEAFTANFTVEEENYTVTFNDTGNPANTATVSVQGGQKVALASVPKWTKAGYDLSWTSGETEYSETEVANQVVNAEVTYTAKWNLKNYQVSLSGLTGDATANIENAYEATIDGYNPLYNYTVTVQIGGTAYTGATVSGNTVTIPAGAVIGEVSISVTSESTFAVTPHVEFVPGYTLVIVHGPETNGYTYDGKPMYRMSHYDDAAKADGKGNAYAYIIKGAAPEDINDKIGAAAAEACEEITVDGMNVNASPDGVGIDDAVVVYHDYNVSSLTDEFTPENYMPVYLRADWEKNYKVDTANVQKILNYLRDESINPTNP